LRRLTKNIAIVEDGSNDKHNEPKDRRCGYRERLSSVSKHTIVPEKEEREQTESKNETPRCDPPTKWFQCFGRSFG
jgi:hypothetical protein